MALNWHVLRGKPHKEEFLARELEARDVAYYYPKLLAKRVNPRARRFKPYFPGYLFVHVNLEKVHSRTLERIPGAANLISFGGELASVPENIVQAIRLKVDEVNAAGGENAAITLRAGDKVNIEDGPFAGYAAIFDASLSGSERVRVLLQMLERRSLPVEMPANYVVAAKRSQPTR